MRMHLVPIADPSAVNYPWVVWNLEVRDPRRLAPVGVADRTRQPVQEVAESLGYSLYDCADDEHDGVPYYSWLVRVPRDAPEVAGLPAGVGLIREVLASLLPTPLTDWDIRPDQDRTRRLGAGDTLRQVYADVLDPFEAALKPLRRDGAEDLEPEAKIWAADQAHAGTYTLWLCAEPGLQFQRWLVLYVGLVADTEFRNSPAGLSLARFGISFQHPVLTTPRPSRPRWMASLDTAFFSTDPTSGTETPHGAGARHQWTSTDPAALLERTVRDLRALYPQLTDRG